MYCDKCNLPPKHHHGSDKLPPNVLQIVEKQGPTLFHQTTFPASIGDETTNPPETLDYKNVLLTYEASGWSYLYSSDGTPTLISMGGIKAVQDIKEQLEELGHTVVALEQRVEELNEFTVAEVDNLRDITGNLQRNLEQEASDREAADNNLQEQIDSMAAATDVIDVVGTYAELESYDTKNVHLNDIIKVLDDETHDGAITYYRWNGETWDYVGSTGPYYTKAETDERIEAAESPRAKNLPTTIVTDFYGGDLYNDSGYTLRMNAKNLDTGEMLTFGTQKTIPTATKSMPGVMSAADKAKLDSIDPDAGGDGTIIVQTHSELDNIPSEELKAGMVAIVTADETQDGKTAYYRYKGPVVPAIPGTNIGGGRGTEFYSYTQEGNKVTVRTLKSGAVVYGGATMTFQFSADGYDHATVFAKMTEGSWPDVRFSSSGSPTGRMPITSEWGSLVINKNTSNSLFQTSLYRDEDAVVGGVTIELIFFYGEVTGDPDAGFSAWELIGTGGGAGGKFYSEYGDNEDGSVTQKFISEKLNSRIVVIGEEAACSATSGQVVIGRKATSKTTSYESVAIGASARVLDNSSSIAVGDCSARSSSVAVGYSAVAEKSSSVAIGNYSKADRDNEFSIGNTRGTSFPPNTRYLSNVTAGERDTDAVNKKQMEDYVAEHAGGGGGSATLYSEYGDNEDGALTQKFVSDKLNNGTATVLGKGASVKNAGSGGVVIGVNATSNSRAYSTESSVVIGNNASASDQYNPVGDCVAIGQSANAYGQQTIAIGRGAYAHGQTSLVIGYQAQTKGISGSNIIIGPNSSTGGPSSIVIGSGCKVGAGEHPKTLSDVGRNVAIMGNVTNDRVYGSVALGVGSDPRAPGVVDIGCNIGTSEWYYCGYDTEQPNTRVLSGVHYGVEDTDAVNVKQLKDAIAELEARIQALENQ